MDVTGVFVVLALFSHFEDVVSQARYKEGMCLEFRNYLRSGDLYCSRDIDPIIGPYGKTHMNKCVMCREVLRERGYAVNDGTGWSGSPYADPGDDECCEYRSQMGPDGRLTCTRENNPVRDVSGQTHTNKCMMCAEKLMQGSIRYNINYGRQPFNPRQKRQAAGDQEVECDKILADLKKERTVCNGLWSPVCGSDGKTYSNKCFLCSEIAKSDVNITLKHEGECPEAIHERVNCSKYPQTRGRVLCKRSAQEVCGTDGETHSNECVLCDRIL
ncbi:hypothetical protein lerEdw1_016086 [Lerista edwardsae]|nr:hypothetical protein lerEdw1_016086 [Lerista edwardsae]